MFTGLIQARGWIEGHDRDRLTVTIERDRQAEILATLAVGDSVAVDGACLTVETILPAGFVAAISPETLVRTGLGRTDQRTAVNLETSLRLGSKLGGHFVTGHIDGVGQLAEALETRLAWELTFVPVPERQAQWQAAIARYLIPKGSIAVNGISLTVAACDRDSQWFRVAVIPHTYAATNLEQLQPGQWVNLESDILGKYVEKLLGRSTSDATTPDAVSLPFLAEHGYL
ncbi:MAG: riboflavin synthase [Spirulinaceae cyanobacterium RM2_2_10]|nr:riboflavin synthase [Spirulinaceae cyanobacterium SM2_1_0]NJO19967.1 riboflavin synthase [Spirulinaceae cyanobacterium RM2_2_10]